jgi:hypothetical protein
LINTGETMPKRHQNNAVRLEFQADSLAHLNLSGAAFTGDWLWVAGDESAGIERLQRLEPVGSEALRYGAATSFALADLLDLPGAPDDEADIEGLAVCDGWLWIVGSHGLKRKNAKPAKDDAENAKRLAKLSLDANRRLLARVPIEVAPDGTPTLSRKAADGRRAARLKGDAEHNQLTRLLEDDPHIGPFLAIPGKDNGFDIEGMAVDGKRLLLGLRGPVLRGWAVLLEVAVEAQGDWLRLAALDDSGALLRKHFLQLGGLGTRDLHFDGDELFVLAGPTMVLDGDIRLLRWSGARQAIAANTASARFEEAFEAAAEIPHSPGADRAEAFCALPPALAGDGPAWLVLYDAPSAARRDGELVVYGDLLRRA